MGLPCLVHGGTETSTKHTFLTTKQERNRAVGLFVTGAQLLKISLSQSGACPLTQQSCSSKYGFIQVVLYYVENYMNVDYNKSRDRSF